LADLRDRLRDLHVEQPKLSLMVQGDKSVPWESMAKVIGAVEASGIPGMSLVTIPPKKTR
jgi:biopolymer transport protein TolR